MLQLIIFPQHLKRIVLLLILISFGFIIMPGNSYASPNDACFAGGCHTSPNSRPIDISLYNSSNHNIIECIDCHENSTNAGELNHGKFIRQLEGTNISGPLTTGYYTENFSLCYYCHNESKVVGVLPGYVQSGGHQNPPKIVSNIRTNFINQLMAGLNSGDYPTNIHWNHLDDFGSLINGLGGQFDSNMDGVRDSYQSCPACHNVHGTNYPKLIKNDLGIIYASDANGNYGYIANGYYKVVGRPGWCNGCHGNGTNNGNVKYYRTEQNVFEDCISCHSTSMTKDFNITAFSQGVHVNINTTDGNGLVNNSDCWTCHYQKDMNKSNIYTCVNCHVQGIVTSAPQITSHKPEKTNKTSCEDCHDLVKLDPGLNDVGQPYPNITSHYAKLPTVPTTNYCDYCHGPNAFSPFQAPDRYITSFYHNSSNASFPGNSTCRTCHTRTDVPADPLANNNSNFHNLTTEYGDVKSTSTANCIDCHINHNTQFANAPTPSHSTSGMVVDDCFRCHGTKVVGSNAAKLHDVRSFVTTGCVQCHAVDRNDVNTSMFGRHTNLNSTGGPNTVTDEDCNTCHFGGQTGDLPMIPGGATPANTYYCQDCHTKAGTGAPKPSDLIIDNTQAFKHGSNQCTSCHAPDMYHVKGTVGPRGRIENPGWPLISNFIYAGCHDCHRTHNGLDEPFHGPGIEPRIVNSKGVIVPGFNHNASNVNNLKNSSECSSSCHFTTVHNVRRMADSLKPKLENLSLSQSMVTANSPVDITANGSSMSGSTSLQIEAAQYQVKNGIGSLMIDWTAMNALDGSFNSGIETVNATINTTGLPEGVYNVSVRVMASAPKTNISLPYYPLNGDWSIPKNATLVIEQPKGFINGTVRNGNGEGVQGATVTANTGDSAITDSTGFYSLRLANGTYTLTATREPEYNVNNTIPQVTVTAPDTVVQDIIMVKRLTGTITGVVTN